MLKVRARVRRRWCGACFAPYCYSRFSIPLHIQFVIRKYFIQFFIFFLHRFSSAFHVNDAFSDWPRIRPYSLCRLTAFRVSTIIILWARSTEVFLSRNLTINRWSIIYYYYLRYLKHWNESTLRTASCKVESWLHRARLLRGGERTETNVDGIETKTTFTIILLPLFNLYISYCREPRVY